MIVQGMTCEHFVRRVEKAILSTGKKQGMFSLIQQLVKLAFLKRRT